MKRKISPETVIKRLGKVSEELEKLGAACKALGFELAADWVYKGLSWVDYATGQCELAAGSFAGSPGKEGENDDQEKADENDDQA